MTEHGKHEKIPKKLVNDPKYCVLDSLSGFVLSHSNVKLLEGCNAVVRSDLAQFKQQRKVSTITGGGSGHEPFAIGYVGKGLLTASIAGDVFAAPSTASVVQATNNCYTDAGVLFIVTNYTGDRLTFGKAVEIAKLEGKNVDMVVVGDDCALSSKDKSAGRRGLCGTVFIHKLAGAMAEVNKSLNEITSFLREAAKEMCTISVSLSSCAIPGKPAGFTIPDDMLEFGLGIHGEAGVAQIKMDSAAFVVGKMIDHIMSSGYMPSIEGKGIALIINNLGGTSNLELSIMAKEALTYLNMKNVSVIRCYVGSFVTSLEMAGVSLTVMLLNEERLTYLDAPCESSLWPKSGTINRLDDITMTSVDNIKDCTIYDVKADGIGLVLYNCTKEICHVFINNEEILNELDRAGGDGDTGTTFSKCATSLLVKFMDELHVKLPINNPGKFLLALAGEVEETMGGSSGALISLFLTAAANGVNMRNHRKSFIKSLELGIVAIEKYGGAEEGDRTMLDALYPALRALYSYSEQCINHMLNMAAKASRIGANSTVGMTAKAGRASYVSRNHLVFADPGAFAIALVFESISQTWEKLMKR